MNLKAILENLDKSVISEETATAIAEAFESAVNEKVDSRIILQVESALAKQDDEHAAKLENLLEAIDTDHTGKLTKVVNTINEDHAAKLNKLVSFYRKAINEQASKFSSKIVDDISSFLDLYLDKVIPQQQIAEAVTNVTAVKTLERIKQAISFDPSSLNEDVKSVITQGKGKIDDLQNQLNESYKENLELNEKVKSLNATILLEQKTKGMPSAKKDYLSKLLSDKSPEYIKENFNYVVEMFEREENESSVSLVQEAKTKAITKDAKVPKTEVIAESSSVSDPVVGGYLSALEGIDKKY